MGQMDPSPRHNSQQFEQDFNKIRMGWFCADASGEFHSKLQTNTTTVPPELAGQASMRDFFLSMAAILPYYCYPLLTRMP